MLMQNEFDGRDEVVFVEYNRVIKNPDQFLLHKLGSSLFSLYEPLLNLNILKNKNLDTCLTIASIMEKPNIFDSFKKDSLPEGWYKNYLDLYFTFPDMFDHCTFLDMGSALYSLLPQKFLKKIIMWSPYEDPRIVDDIYLRYTDNTKIVYEFGKLSDVLSSQTDKITTFILGDAYHIQDIIDYKDVEFSEIMLAQYRFNQTYTEEKGFESIVDSEKLIPMNIKLSEFTPATLKAKHFEELINN